MKNQFKKILRKVFFSSGILLIISCSTDDSDSEIFVEEEAVDQSAEQVAELTGAMQKYLDFDTALNEGYDRDASGYVPQMGHHYINDGLVDGRFDLLKPEILLYVPDGESMALVGVEYMIPFTDPDNPQPAPSGFNGNQDVWERNTRMNAWTLHVWIIKENPSGLFAPLNPSLP